MRKTLQPWLRAFAALAFLVLLVFVPGAYLLLKHPVTAQAAWFDTNWGFRTRYPVSNSSGSTVTNFQTQFTIDTSTLITNGKLQSSCQDVRFTNAGGKQLPFWIEPNTCNTTSTIIWVNVDSIPTSGADIYFYYGNASVAAANYTTQSVFLRDLTGTVAVWPLDDTTSTQSFSRVNDPLTSPGRNIVINGTFDVDANWAKATGWTISGGAAHANISGIGNLNQTTPIVIGKVYAITFTVSNYSAGTVRSYAGSSSSGPTRTANGTYTDTLVAIGDNQVYIQGSNFVGDIDNVSAVQVNVPSSSTTQTPIITDGNMEAATTTAWMAINSATITKQTGTPHSGSQVLRIARNGVATPGAIQATQVVGQVYRAYGYARSDGSATPRVLDNGVVLFTGTTSTTWQPFDVVYVATTTNFRLDSTTNTGTQYVEFDDVVVTLDTTIRPDQILSTLDGNMEQSGTSYWTVPTSGTLSKQTSSPHGGTQVLRITSTGGANPAAQQSLFVAGKTYHLTGYARSDGNAIPQVSPQATGCTSFTTSTSWQFFDCTYIATNTAFRLQAQSTPTSGQYVEFDDVTLNELPPESGLPTNGVAFPTTANGHLTNAYSFDGTNDNVNIYSSDLNSAFNPSEGTAVVWAKVSGSGVWTDSTNRQLLYLTVDGNNFVFFRKAPSSNQLLLSYGAGGTSQSVNITTSTTSWMMIALTWSKSNNQVIAYLNGAQSGSTQTGLGTWVGNLVSTTTDIGASSSGGANPWSGLINDVHLYNRALSAQEISDLYGNGTIDRQAYTTNNYTGHELLRQYSTGVTVGSAATEETGLAPIVYWKFDDGTGTTVNDSSTNRNSGTLGGSTIPTWQLESQCISGKCLYFDGTSSKVTGSKIANNVQSIAFWIRPNTIATQGLLNLDGGTHKISTNGSGVVSATGFTSPTYYINGVATATPTLVQNQWNYVEITTGTSFNTTSSFTIGTDGTNFIKGFIDEPKFYNYARSVAQVKADYLQGAARAGSSSVQGLQPSGPLSNGLVGYWKMDEASWNGTTGEVIDSSGNGNNGTGSCNGACTTTFPTTTQGKFGNGGSFNSTTNQRVFLADTTSLQPTSAVTMCAWTYPTATPANQAIMGRNGSYGLVHVSSGAPRTEIWIGGVNNTVSSTTPEAVNQWNFICGTYDGVTEKLYQNGVVTASAPLTGTISTPANNLTLGWLGGGTFGGTIDEARLYNRALSSAEVSQLYNYAPGPVGWWKMDERTGTTANDSSGYGNTGTWAGSGSPHWVTGKYGSAGNFNPGAVTSDQVSINDSPSLDITGTITLSAWVKPNSLAGNERIIKKIENTSYALDYSSTTGIIRPQITIGGVKISCPSATTTPLNTWTYVSATYDGANIKVYLNGILSATCAATGAIGTDSNQVILGNAAGGTFQGLIDDVRIYNYARTQSQILEDMRGSGSDISNVAGSATGGQPATPLGYWKFDEGYATNATNFGSAGTALNGTLTNMASPATTTSGWNNAGKINKALEFDNSNDYVAMPSDLSQLKITSDLTLDAWINLTSTSDTNDIICKYTGTASTSAYCLEVSAAGKLVMVVVDSSGPTAIFTTGNTTLSTSTWYHVVGVFKSGSTVTLYINGAQDGQRTGAVPTTLQNPTTILDIGAENAGSNPFNGMIDEPKIYNFALTPQQVQTDYNAGLSVNYGVGANSEASTLSDGAGNPPVAYWNFDEKYGTTVNDRSGNANTGTWNGTGSHWAQGKIGTAGNFNGTNNYVSAANASSLNISGTISVGAWFKLNASASGINTILDKRSSAGTDGYMLRYNLAGPNRFEYRVDTSGATTLLTTSATLSTNVWHFAEITYDSANIKLYFDGSLIATTARTGTVNTNSSTLYIGADAASSGTSDFFNGSIDDVKIYSYARTQAQVEYDYNRGAPVGWWKMDECQGSTINDNSGNGNTGTLTVGASGTQTSVGTCNTSGTAWGNGATGKFNASLNFDGTDDFVTTTQNSTFNITGNFTISGWFKTTDTAARTPLMIRSGSIGSNDILGGIVLNVSTGKASFDTWDFATNRVTGTRIINNGTWHLITGVFSGGTASLYVDGNFDASKAQSGGPVSENKMLRMGGNIAADNSATQLFNGSVDDVRIFNYALSQSQIQRLYNDGQSVFYGPATGTP